MKTWKCKNCETKNKASDITCEVCDNNRPILKSCKYELSDVFGAIKVFWDTDAEKIEIIKQKKKLEVEKSGVILLEGCKNKEKIVFLLNNSIAEYQEELIVLLEKPEITLFHIENAKLVAGTSTQIKWKVKNGTKIIITGLGKVENTGIADLKIERNQVKITAENEIGKVERSIDIEIIPLPIIKFISNQKIELGDKTKLNWNVGHSLKVVLLHDEKEKIVSNSGEEKFLLIKATTFKLIATALDNKTTVEKEINIEVFPKPEIKYFKANPEIIISSMPVTLSWKVENAKKVEINNGIGEVSAEGQKEDVYRENTLYKITAIGELSTVSQNVIVRIFPTPTIESLQVPMPDFESRINLNPIKISSPKIDVSINIPELNLNLLNCN
ncbi:MAG: zinc finger Ran-binding domain-containing protein, partial [Rickettsiales bacterium]|nr:zinc finger Ran-binding domain-containing protein [Rickettsiales bacterium]